MNMTPEQALNMLAQAVASIQANLEQHQALQTAVNTIAQVLESLPATPAPANETVEAKPAKKAFKKTAKK